MVNMYEDRELVDKIANGNKSAFSILIKKYEKMVWFMVSKMVLDEHEIKDICQEVFIKVYLNLDKFNFQSKLSTWIATIAYRFTLNQLKKKKKVSYLDFNEGIIIDYLPNHETPLNNLEQIEKKTYIQNMVDGLPIQYRTIVTLYHLNDFSYKEIAEITVKIARRRKTIRDIIKKIMLYSVVSVPFIVLSLIVTCLMGPGLFWKILEMLNGNAASIVFTGVLIILIQLLDITLVKNKFKELIQMK